jgi:plastocyanin
MVLEFWIQIENHPWDVCPNNIDRMMGTKIHDPGTAPTQLLKSPVTGASRSPKMFKPMGSDALILRAYTANWAAPADKKVNPWDINEPDPTDTGTMGTIPGATIECNLIDSGVIVHFRNMDTRLDPNGALLPVERRTHSLHPHGFVFDAAYDGAYPLSPPDTKDPDNKVPAPEVAAWASVGVTGQFKIGDRVPPGGTFKYHWNTFTWHPTAGVWLYHDHSICADDNINHGAIGTIVIHPADSADNAIPDLPGGSPLGSPIQEVCFPIIGHGKLSVPIHAIASLGAAASPRMERGMPMGQMGNAAMAAPKGAAKKGAPPSEDSIRLATSQFLDPGLTLRLSKNLKEIGEICFPVFIPTPNNAQYLLLFHELEGVGMCINGRKFMGNTPTLISGPSTQMRFGVVGMGSDTHTFHIHGHRWPLLGPHGNDPGTIQNSPQDTPVSQFEDTRLFGPANSFVVSLKEGSFMGTPVGATGNPADAVGEFHLHCHVLAHMADGMMGSLLVIQGGETAFALPVGVMCPPIPAPTPVTVVLPPGPKTVPVHIKAGPNRFDPDPVDINAGDTVNWIWDVSDHSTTSDTAVWDSGVHNFPFSFPHTFPVAGTFPYYCLVHGGPGGAGMHGTVKVH